MSGLRWSQELLDTKIKEGNVKLAAAPEKRATLSNESVVAKALSVAVAPKRSKYGNEKTNQDGEIYDSKKEARRAKELRMMLKGGQLAWLARQVTFVLPGSVTYIADFVYAENGWDEGGGQLWQIVVEDVKSEATKGLATYRMKKKQMEAIHGIIIQEI